MQKKYIIIVISVVLAAGLLYLALNRSWISTGKSTAENDTLTVTTAQTAVSEPVQAQNAGEATEQSGEQASAGQPLSEDIKVLNNTAEYDIKCSLVKEQTGSAYLKLDFYLDGSGTTRELQPDKIPMLSSLAKASISAVYLNPAFDRLYLIFTTGSEIPDFSIYSYSLRDDSASEVFSASGKPGELGFTKDFKYMAFSYLDNPASSILQEASVLQVISCENNKAVVNASRTEKGERIGQERDPKLVYDYYFLSWNSNNEIKLREETYAKSGDGKKASRELLYNINTGTFANADGTKLTPPGVKPDENKESAAAKAFKEFYGCLSEEAMYDKAMGMLDDSFTIELDIFKQFDIEYLSKSDINSEDATVYSDLLKSARMENIVKEENSGKSKITLYFYQVLGTPQQQIRQALKAELVQKNGKWLISSINECDPEKAPFSPN